MPALETSDRELAVLMTQATKLAAEYWASLEERPSYPSTSGAETARQAGCTSPPLNSNRG